MRRVLSALLFSIALAMSAEAAHVPVSLEDLTLLAQTDLSDETILSFLKTREIGFELSGEEIARLREQGVSEEILRYLLERTGTAAEDGVYAYDSGAYPHPARYYVPYYYYPFGAGAYLGFAILPHWWYGHHVVDHHLFGGHHYGRSLGRPSTHGSGHHASAAHSSGGHRSRAHASAGHSGRRHAADSHGGRHSGTRHSGGHGGGHSGGGHGGGHSGGGHGGGHSGGHGGH